MDIAENETRYVTGDDQVDVNGTSYAPSDLAVQAGKKITLPKDASFADAELSLGGSGRSAGGNGRRPELYL